MKKLILLCLTILIIFCSSCNSQQDPQLNGQQEQIEEREEDLSPVKGGTLFLSSFIPDTLNPLLTKSKSTSQMFRLIYEGLVTYDKNMNVLPALAESWQVSEDGTTWNFFLRKDVKWHDNSQFTAKDVDYTFRIISSNQYNSVYKFNTQNISYFGIVDEYTFKVVLNKPYGNFLLDLNFPIIAKHQFEGREKDTDNMTMKPVGTGPYVFSSHEPLKEIKLKANSSWWTKQEPYIDEIIVKILPDEEAAFAALEAKEIDYLTTDVIDRDKYGGKDNIGIKEYVTNYYEFIGVNFQNIVLQDPAVRKAIAYSINRSELVSEVLLGHGKISDVPINPESWLYEASSNVYEFNLQKAKELLQQSGWSDLNQDGILEKTIEGSDIALSFELITNEGNIIRQKSAELIVEQLKEVGMNVNLRIVPWDELNKLINSKNFDTVLTGLHLAANGDLSFAFHSNGIQKGSNIGSYANPTMDQLLEDAFTKTDKTQIKEAYAHLQRQIVEDLPYISLYFRTSAVLYNTRLKGEIEPICTNIYNNIHKCYLAQ